MNGPQLSVLRLSPLAHLWLVDIDGTILAHNAHLSDGDVLLPGVSELWKTIPVEDSILLLSAREEQFREPTLKFLQERGLRFDGAVFGLPTGERILINDTKPSGLATAVAINVPRNVGLGALSVSVDPEL